VPEILEGNLEQLYLNTLIDGGEAEAASQRARGYAFLEEDERTEQELPPLPGEGPDAPEVDDLDVWTVQPAEPLLRDRIAQATTTTEDIVAIGFDQSRWQVGRWAIEEGGKKIREINQYLREAITHMVGMAQVEGVTVRNLAREIYPRIGLTQYQNGLVTRLGARMRDRTNWGKTVTAWNGQLHWQIPPRGPSDELVHRAQRRYGRRIKRARAENIARTETVRAANEGQRQMWLQQQEQGLLPTDVKRVWIITPDDRLCRICRGMTGQIRGLDQKFQTGSVFGEVSGPPAHPQCRCATGLVKADRAPGLEPAPFTPRPKPIKPKPVKPKAPQPTLGQPVPETPPAAQPALPTEHTPVSWTDFGVKLPRDKERRELLEAGLNRALSQLPPGLRGEFIRALQTFDRIEFRFATASTKNIGALGFVESSKGAQGGTLSRLMLQLYKYDDDYMGYVTAKNAKYNELLSLYRQGKIDRAARWRQFAEWEEAHPKPPRFVLQTEQEMAGTITHELAHAIDILQGTGYTNHWGISGQWYRDHMQSEVWRAYWQGNAKINVAANTVEPLPGAVRNPTFTYATEKTTEGFAESMRLYFNGSSATETYGTSLELGDVAETLTALEWRAKYPELARWIEQNVIALFE
jgi:hypothetical protein